MIREEMRSDRRGLPVPSLPVLALVPALAFAACGGVEDTRDVSLAEGVSSEGLQQRVEQFAPVTISFDTTLLDAGQKAVLADLVRASDVLDTIFRTQVWRENLEYASALADAEGPGMEAARDYYGIMYGPWDRLEENEPFLAVGAKPAGAGYYPEDLTSEELQAWIEAHPDDREAFTSYYTVIVRGDGDSLQAVPYAEHYGDRLARAAALLDSAAARAENPTLDRFLRLRAEAFRTNEYFESEVAWMGLAGNRVDPTIGPYEVYEDELAGYKAAFESFVTVKDPEESARLEELVSYLPDLESALPIPERHKNLDRPFTSPISVVDVAYTAGDTRAGVQTLAFNLPNDPRVREQEGSKKVMLKNVIQAKFDHILKPIARAVLDSAQAERIGVEPYFVRILMHELAHGLGPDYVTGDTTLTVNKALRERYSALEEAKADAVGSHSLRVLAERGVYTEEFLEEVYVDHVADLFRCVRFGVGEAHGKGCLSQFNYLRERGAIDLDEETGRYAADLEAMPEAMAALAREYLTIEATGDYERAGAFMEEYGRLSPEMEAALERLEAVPVDIHPTYAVKEWIAGW